MKKIVSFAIVFLLLISIHIPATTVFAAKLSDNLIMRLTETHTESQIDINVKLVTNTGVSGMTLELVYDKNVFVYDGYQKGAALESLDLMSTDLSENPTLPVKFNWFSQNASNDFSTGNILKLHFHLKPNAPAGEYEIGFRYNNGDIIYIDNSPANSKSAVISKAVVNIAENKISDTAIVEEAKHTNVFLILGIVAISISVVVGTIVLVKKIKKEKARKKNWLEV